MTCCDWTLENYHFHWDPSLTLFLLYINHNRPCLCTYRCIFLIKLLYHLLKKKKKKGYVSNCETDTIFIIYQSQWVKLVIVKNIISLDLLIKKISLKHQRMRLPCSCTCQQLREGQFEVCSFQRKFLSVSSH